MKTLLFFLFSLFIATNMMAQDSWKVLHNGAKKLQASGEETTAGTVVIKKVDLKKKGSFDITYTEGEKQAGWQRHYALVNEKNEEVLTSKGATLKVLNTKLAALVKSAQTLQVYTWSLPTDPAVAATVRVRRIHLCTLSLKG